MKLILKVILTITFPIWIVLYICWMLVSMMWAAADEIVDNYL